MAHGLVNQTLVQGLNVDANWRSAIGSADLDSGNLVVLGSLSTTAGESEVWTATRPESGTLVGTWMVADPEVVITYGGVAGTSAYSGLDPDPRSFYVKSGRTFRVLGLAVRDIIELSADAIATGTGAGSAFAVVTAATYKLTWASAAVTGLSLKLIGTSYVSLATGAIGETQRQTMYKFEVVAI